MEELNPFTRLPFKLFINDGSISSEEKEKLLIDFPHELFGVKLVQNEDTYVIELTFKKE